MLETFTMQTFSEQLNTNFRIQLGDADAMEAQLVEVTDNGTTPYQEQFSLVFRTPRDRPPQQGLYKIEHEKLGEFEMLLVPVRSDKQGMNYEAVFNRLLEGE
ncbi:MAG TPA: hypothetical protein VJX74_16375 [Blastocatellia bacterium]|nr:hypothetical protein [Blastocatellia bacterium]